MTFHTGDPTHSLYKFGNRIYDLNSRTHVMGILNITTDSFSDGGKYFAAEDALRRSEQMITEGADFIDIGGESTRPGSTPLSAEEELRRVIPVIEKLAKSSSVPISIDTYKAQVANEALNAGATIVNDISALRFDPKMADVIAQKGATVILMHMQGTPSSMQQNPVYGDIVKEVAMFLSERATFARTSGIGQILLDPGIGFGKTSEHNLELMRGLQQCAQLGCPLVIGTSRKSFIGKVLDLPVEDRFEGTAATVAVAILRGANIVRVHDIKSMKRIALMTDALKNTSVSLDESHGTI
jgi:dihydropteroate synthase